MFVDGARIVGHQFHDPPSDPVELLRTRKEFAVRKLASEQVQFAKYKQDVIRQAESAMKFKYVPAPGDSSLEDLRRGKARILALRETISDIDAALSETREAEMERERQAEESQRQMKISAYLSELKTIDV